MEGLGQVFVLQLGDAGLVDLRMSVKVTPIGEPDLESSGCRFASENRWRHIRAPRSCSTGRHQKEGNHPASCKWPHHGSFATLG